MKQVLAATAKLGFRYGNPAVQCERAQMTAVCRQLGTVVSIAGELDSANVDRAVDYAARYVLAEKPFVLDLQDVDAFGDSAIALVYAVDDTCHAAGVDWALVVSPAVQRVMDFYGDPAAYHTEHSVPDALHRFAVATDARRRLVPILTKSA